jgi:carboxymethylenebutenolidase
MEILDRQRRQLLVAGAGFALSVQPLAASTLHTPAEGLTTGFVTVPVGTDNLPVYRAQPAATTTHLPTVIVIQEIFGVHEHIQDVCRRLARAGYLALAPELYFRQGNPGQITDIPTLQKEIVARVPDAQVLADLDAVAAWAAGQGGDARRLAVTGFCWGGRMTWLYAAHAPQVKAGVAWYGRLVGDQTARTPRQPLDVAASLKVPVLGLYGGQDKGIPLDTVEQMRTALGKGHSGSRIVVFPQAQHGFHADYRPSYDREAAQSGWQQALAWLRQHGV